MPDLISESRDLDVVVQPRERCVVRGGERVYLRSKSFELLMLLLERRSEVVTRGEATARLWPGVAVCDNSLSQCVADLRRVFDDDARSPRFIRTIPKVGLAYIGPPIQAIEESEPRATAADPAVASGSRWRTGIGLVVLLILSWGLQTSARSDGLDENAEAAWWRFDEAVRMESNAGAVSRVAGRSGSAIRFDSAFSFLSGVAPRLPAGALPRTVSVWVQAVPNGDRALVFHYGGVQKTAATDAFGLWLNEAGTAAGGTLFYGTAATGKTRVADGNWHLLAATYEGAPSNAVRLYVDGVEEGRASLPGPAETAGSGEWYAGRFPRQGVALRGAIDDLRVYGRALGAREIQAMYRCMESAADLVVAGRDLFFMPIWPNRPMALVSGEREIRDPGSDLSGIQFAPREGGCSLKSLRGADLGQDLRIEADVLVDVERDGRETQAGPYFRSRRARAGDGILGGTSAGYWVRLGSDGAVRVSCLNPNSVIAFSKAVKGFDSARWHHLRVDAAGAVLRVWLDGGAVGFDQEGRRVDEVRLAPLWKDRPYLGANEGAAGVAFLSLDRSVRTPGRQAVKNLVVTRL